MVTKRALLISTSVLAALTVAGPAAASHRVAPISGVVVGSQRGALLVASPSGAVRAVRGRAAVGARVAIDGRRVLVLGKASRATLRGVVVSRTGSTTFLSAASHVFALRHLRGLSSAADHSPPAAGAQPGTVVQTTVGIDDDGDLEEQAEHELGQAGQVHVQAVVAAVGPGTVTLTVNGQQLTISLPAGLTLPATVVGTQVTLDLSFATGATTAVGDDDEGDDDDDGGSGAITVGTTTFGSGNRNSGASGSGVAGSARDGHDGEGDGGGGDD